MLGNRKRNGLDKHVEQISFGQWVTFCEPRWLKGWQPHFQPTVAKSWILTSVPWFAAVSYHHCNKSWTPQLRDQTLCFFAWDWFFSAAATQGWEWCNHNAGLEWRLRFHKRHGFLRQTCMKNLLSAVRHALRTWQLKGWQPASNPLLLKAESWQVFLSLQQSHTTIVTNLGHHNCVTKPSASLHETFFFAQLQRRDGNDATIMQNC